MNCTWNIVLVSLPNFKPADPLALHEFEAPAGADSGVGGGADLRNYVNSLLDATRDLLGNIQLCEILVEVIISALFVKI